VVQPYRFFHIHPSFFARHQDKFPALLYRHIQRKGVTFYVVFRDGLYWAIPHVHDAARYRRRAQAMVRRGKRLNTVVFTESVSPHTALLLQQAFPVLPLYLSSALTDASGVPIRLADAEEKLTDKWLVGQMIRAGKGILPFAADVEGLRERYRQDGEDVELWIRLLAENPAKEELIPRHSAFGDAVRRRLAGDSTDSCALD